MITGEWQCCAIISETLNRIFHTIRNATLTSFVWKLEMWFSRKAWRLSRFHVLKHSNNSHLVVYYWRKIVYVPETGPGWKITVLFQLELAITIQVKGYVRPISLGIHNNSLRLRSRRILSIIRESWLRWISISIIYSR